MSEMGDFLTDVDVGAGRSVLSVAAGADTTCVLLDSYVVKCWGGNIEGELGRESQLDFIASVGNTIPAIDFESIEPFFVYTLAPGPRGCYSR